MKVDLRAYRLDRGWSAQRLADDIGVSIDVIYHLERNGRRPFPTNAYLVADYFDLKPSEMWPESDKAAA